MLARPRCRMRVLGMFVSSGKKFPPPWVMSVRDPLCEGSLMSFLLCLCSGSPENAPNLLVFNSSVANGVIPKSQVGFKWNNPEGSFPVLPFCPPTPHIPGNSHVRAVPKWVSGKLQEFDNDPDLCLYSLALIFPYPQPL